MRLFFAVPIDEAVRARVCEVAADLAVAGADVKWVEPQNLHLTLAFLGETAPDRLPALRRVAAAAAARPAFVVSFSEVGAFESRGRPRVLWIGIAEGVRALTELTAALIAGLRREGFAVAERPFQPHLTIGRLRGEHRLELLLGRLRAWGDPRRLAAPTCRAERLALYESRLSAAGPTYTALCEETLHA